MIRRPEFQDLDQLQAFFHLVIEDTYIKEGLADLKKEIEEEVQSKLAYVKDDLESQGRDHHFLILEDQGKIIGTAAYGPSSHLIYDHMPGLKTVPELGSVLIHPDFQGQGHGSKLVDAIIESLSKGNKSFCLDSGYTIAKKIWTKRFGPPSKVLKDFWGPGFDHYIWHINL